MKKKISIFLFFISIIPLKAQETEVFYGNFDKKPANDWQRTYKWVTTTMGNQKIEQMLTLEGTMLKSTPYIFVKNWNPIRKDSVSKWLIHGTAIVWDEEKMKMAENQYHYGIQHGYSKTYYPTGELMKKNSFYSGILQNSYFYYDTGEAFLTYDKEAEDVWLPQKKDVMAFLKSHFVPVYSYLAYEPEKVYLKLTVGTDGILKDWRIINSNNRKAMKVFTELVRKVPKFYPAFKNGEPIEQTILLPIKRYEHDRIFFSSRPINPENLPDQRTLYNREKMLGPLRMD